MEDTAPVVTLPNSVVPGQAQKVVGKKSVISYDIEEFRGIPYGVIPGRWEHSTLRQSLPQYVYHAVSNGPKCPQPSEMNSSTYFQSYLEFPTDVVDSELDCLNLFIIRPSRSALTRTGCDDVGLPVLLWIHGGGYGYGASTDQMWDPTRLVMRSISLGTPFIAVCLNYRLSIFGFAASSDILNAQSESSSFRGCNFGLHDQKVGLVWVSHNISAFGGDPHNITLGGQSAGACSVHVHTLEAKLEARKPALFRRAIIQSGSIGCLGPISLETANTHWEELCQQVEVQSRSDVTRLKYLQTMTTADLLHACKILNWVTFPLVVDGLSIMDTTLDFGVTVDFGDIKETYPAIEGLQVELIEVLIGDTEAEGKIFSHPIREIRTFEEVQSIFRAAYSSVSAADEALRAYKLISGVSLDDLHCNLVQFANDVTFGYPVYKAKNSLAAYRPQRVESSGFNYHGQENALTRDMRQTAIQTYRVEFGNPFPGENHNIAHHCVDMIYQFDAFHDALRAVDKCYQSSGAPKQKHSEPNGFPISTSTTNSGYPLTATSPRKNADLVLTMQTDWINFIVGKGIGRKKAWNDFDAITLYSKGRTASVTSYLYDPKWAEERKRYEILGLHPAAMKLALQHITKAAMSC